MTQMIVLECNNIRTSNWSKKILVRFKNFKYFKISKSFCILECDGFKCDANRCISKKYVCDGYLDCKDQSDEINCPQCDNKGVYCGGDKCISSRQICDGNLDCPYGQDERNCRKYNTFCWF